MLCYDKSASPKPFEKYFIFLFGFTMSIRKPISVTRQKSTCSWQQLTLKAWDHKDHKVLFSTLLAGLISATYCVEYPHVMPFLRNNLAYSMLKLSKNPYG